MVRLLLLGLMVVAGLDLNEARNVAPSKQPRWCGGRRQLRHLQVSAVLELLLSVQYRLALHVKRLRLL